MTTRIRTSNIEAALALCERPKDRTLPRPITEALARIEKFNAFAPGGPAKADDLGEQLAAAPLDTFDDVLDDASREYARRTLMAALTVSGWRSRNVPAIGTRSIADALPEIVGRLRPVYDAAVAELTEAAPQLPAGEAAVDPESVLRSNAGDPWRRSDEAARRLVLIGAVFPVPLRSPGYTPRGTAVVPVVALPAATVPARTHPYSGEMVNAPAEQKAIRAVREVVKSYDASPRLALIDIARGRFEGVRFELADPASNDVEQRVEQVARAHTARRATGDDAA